MTEISALDVLQPYLWIAAFAFTTGFSGFMILHGLPF
jgi:hypothetical protein